MFKLLKSLVFSLLFVFATNAYSLDRGGSVYKQCRPCHGPQGYGNPKIQAPSIAGLPAWYVEAQLGKWISGARSSHPKDIAGQRMRPMARTLRDTPEDLKLVSAHVAQLPRRSAPHTIDASPIRGEVTYQTCAACHGADGMGNQVLNAPPIAGSSDWYLLTQLKNFKAGIRGGNPAVDINGATMMGIATTLDEQSMLDVISYINLLGDTGAAK